MLWKNDNFDKIKSKLKQIVKIQTLDDQEASKTAVFDRIS